MLSSIVLNVCIVLVLFESGFTQKFVNDSCVFQNGRKGQCLRFENCPSAIQMVHSKKGKLPENCGFEGKHPIVCCEVRTQLQRRKVGEISNEKCKEMYLTLPATTTTPKPTTTTTEATDYPDDITIAELIAILQKKEEQALKEGKPIDTVHKAAVGGKDAAPKEFLHMAVLGYGEQNDITWACGGSLISEKFVLTAAHCIHTQLGIVRHVRLGDLNLNSTTDIAKPQNFNVLRTFVHPRYRAPSVYNDIAIIELSANVIIDDYVRPGCLFTEAEIPTEAFSATGWGLTSFQGTPADHLQEVQLYEYAQGLCLNAYKSISKIRLANGIDKDTHLCAGDERQDTCQGDSGGPLQIKNSKYPRGYSIVGVTSFGKACGIGKQNISVYTRVSYYVEWIESIVWPES